MPTYEYACSDCGHEMEAFQRMSDDPLELCPSCNTASLKRKIGLGAGIIFKGGGFYETDFKDKKGGSSPASPKATSGGDGKESSPSKSDTAGSSRKSDTD